MVRDVDLLQRNSYYSELLQRAADVTAFVSELSVIAVCEVVVVAT